MSRSLLSLFVYVTWCVTIDVRAIYQNGIIGSHSNISLKCESAYYTPPKCIDHPDGYGCDCGPGFYWNTYYCVSTAVDSRLEFSHQTPVRYTVLLRKAFPRLEEFTIALWLKVPDSTINGTILSYKHGSTLDLLYMRSGPNLTFQVWDLQVKSSVVFRNNLWYHVVWTWSSKNGRWALYINGRSHITGTGPPGKPIPLGGEFVLGQASRDEFKFNEQFAFVGEISHLNIWSFSITPAQVSEMKTSCDLMFCGDAVQWIDLRTGTRGAMKMRWPSGILSTKGCFTEDEIGISCNKYCSYTIGAQCNEQIVENIRWERTKAMNTMRVPCPIDTLKPKPEITPNANDTAVGTRYCNLMVEENEGEWAVANIDDCISQPLRALKYKFQQYLLAKYTDESTVLELCENLLNHTASESYGNPVDVATVIDLLEMLVNTQAGLQEMEVKWNDGNKTYAKALDRSPTRIETEEFMQLTADIVNNLLNKRHDSGWNATRPLGVEGDNLMKVLETLAHVLSVSLDYHVRDLAITREDAWLKLAKPEIELNIQAQWIEHFRGTRFPRDKMYASNLGEIEMPDAVTTGSNDTDVSEFIKIAIVRVRGMAVMLPNHDPRMSGIKAKEDNVNTPIIAMFLYGGRADISTNMSAPLTYTLPYLDTFNISNPECVRLEHGTINGGRINQWRWTRDGCMLREDRGTEGVCECSVAGVFAITTDMYNDNWNKGEIRPILMSFASYIGCCASMTLCLATCILHIYYKTSSSTAALHKNLGVSVVLGQLSFMIGIDLYDHQFVCQIFAILLHYFFLANFSWLMNEAFNLYIVITYSSHAHGGHQESGSLLRYYILGWVIPGVLVGSFVGSQGENYYAKDMCWISWDNLWLFIGPAIGIISVSIMVLIFTAKEHNENSYTKSEESNKFITLHSNYLKQKETKRPPDLIFTLLLMKALWTQIILITVVWSFAFISLKMSDRILKYIFGLFNCLQGSFFFVFYLLLNEEVRTIFKTNQKKKTLSAHGYEDTDDRSIDSQASGHFVEKDRLETLALDPRPRRRKDQKRRHKKHSHVHMSDEDKIGSDCEMITSV